MLHVICCTLEQLLYEAAGNPGSVAVTTNRIIPEA